MIALLAEVPYWGQSLLRVLGGLVAVLLPAGTIVYIFLFKLINNIIFRKYMYFLRKKNNMKSWIIWIYFINYFCLNIFLFK